MADGKSDWDTKKAPFNFLDEKAKQWFLVGAPACEMMYHVVVFNLSILKDVCLFNVYP